MANTTNTTPASGEGLKYEEVDGKCTEYAAETGTSAGGEGHEYKQVGGGGGGVAVSTWRLEEEEEGTFPTQGE